MNKWVRQWNKKKNSAQHNKSYVTSFMTRHDFYKKTTIGEQVTLDFWGSLLLQYFCKNFMV